MGGLLGVLIAVYLLFYKCGEFGGKIDRQSKEKWHKERMKRWGLEIVDEEMEEDFRHMIRDPRYHDQVWHEVRDAYAQMPLHRSRTSWKNEEEALTIMMARRGKLPARNARFGETLARLRNVDKEFYFIKSFWDEDLEFWEYIEGELQRLGIKDARLFFEPAPWSPDGVHKCFPSELDRARFTPGTITWLPLTRYDDKGRYIHSCYEYNLFQ